MCYNEYGGIMEFIKKIKMYTLLVSLIYAIIGFIMLLNPQFVLDGFNYVIGILALIYGVIYIAKFLGRKNYNTLSKFNLIIGLVCIIFGVYVLINPTLLSSIIPFAIGLLLIVDGFGKLKDSLTFKKVDYRRWWIGLVVAIIFVGFGIYIIVNAFNVSKLIIRIIGAILIIDALTDIWAYFGYKKYSPKKETTKELIEVKEANIVEVKEK